MDILTDAYRTLSFRYALAQAGEPNKTEVKGNLIY